MGGDVAAEPTAAPGSAEVLHHVVVGDARDVALLLIHPLGGDLHFWDECVVLLSPRFACVACDLRSAGRSPRAAGPVSIEDHVRDLEALRRVLGLDAVVPVGCAIGAMTAAAYAVAHSDATRALVLTNPTARTTAQARMMLARRAELVRAGGMGAILPDAVDRAFLAQPRDARYRRYYDRFAAQDADAYALSVLGVLDADISAALPAIRCPTLVLAGAHDVLLLPETARAVHALIPGAEFAIDEDAAHFLPYQRPEGFARLVAGFLDRCARPRG
jgi:3-oxoadipate enol-lactonase